MKIFINIILILFYTNVLYAQTIKDLSPVDYLSQDFSLLNKNISGDYFNENTSVKHWHLLIIVVDSNIYHITKENVDSMVAHTNRYFQPWKFEFCYSVEFIADSQLTIAQSLGEEGTYPKHRFEMMNVIIKDWSTLGQSGNPIQIDYSVVVNNSFWGGIALAHELGHDLMLSHTTDSINIMYPTTNGMVLPVSFDSAQANTMHYYAGGGFIGAYNYSFNSYATLLSFGEEVCLDLQGLPYSRFYSDIHGGCNPLTINFFDNSSFNSSSYSWNFGDGTTSNLKNPAHTYTQQGEYNVTHSVYNLGGGKSVTKNKFIVVNNDLQNLPVKETFESTVFPPENWYIENDFDYLTWGRDNDLTSAYVDDFYNNTIDGTSNSLISSSYNFSNTLKPQLIFAYAYNWYNFGYPDTLNLYYSTDCGNSYYNIFLKYGIDLKTSPNSLPYYTKFTPDSTNDWKTDTIDLSSLAGITEGVIFKFEFVHGSKGNFLYIDNIKIQDQCDETVAIFDLEKDTINIFTSDTAKFINISTIATSWFWNFGDGATSIEENPTHIYGSTGIYTISLIASNNECADTNTKELVVINYNSVNYQMINDKLKIFPNPSTGQITISTEKAPIETIEIYNSIGNKSDEILFKNNTTSYTYNNLQKLIGLYFIKVKTKENVYTRKIVFR